jgi:hypothetical protein
MGGHVGNCAMAHYYDKNKQLEQHSGRAPKSREHDACGQHWDCRIFNKMFAA